MANVKGMGAGRWKRLQRIRSLEEQQARVELERVNQALRAAEKSVGEQLVQRTTAQRAARAALLAGERTEWHLAEAVREVSEWNLEKMQRELVECAAAVEPATINFMTKRREDEQMKALRKKMQLSEEAERRRLEQQAADEWFGQSRQRGTGTYGDA